MLLEMSLGGVLGGGLGGYRILYVLGSGQWVVGGIERWL